MTATKGQRRGRGRKRSKINRPSHVKIPEVRNSRAGRNACNKTFQRHKLFTNVPTRIVSPQTIVRAVQRSVRTENAFCDIVCISLPSGNNRGTPENQSPCQVDNRGTPENLFLYQAGTTGKPGKSVRNKSDVFHSRYCAHTTDKIEILLKRHTFL